MEQLRLFEPPEEPKRDLHPGQLSFPDWLKRSDIVYHASFRPDWEQAPYAHVGTQQAASDRLLQMASNQPEPREGSETARVEQKYGRIYARRMATPARVSSRQDSLLNSAQWHVEKPEFYTLGGMAEKDRPHAELYASELRAGHPVGYWNYAEDIGRASYLAPKGTLRSWEQDVSEAQSKGLEIHGGQLSQQFDPAIEVTPRSMKHNVKRVMHYHELGGPEQGSLMPYAVGEKVFPVRPEAADEPNESGWHAYSSWERAGRISSSSWKAATEYAEEHGGKAERTYPYDFQGEETLPRGRTGFRKYRRP